MRREISSTVAVMIIMGGVTACDDGSGVPPWECTPAESTGVSIEVDEPVALADQPVHLRVSGLDPGAAVTVWAETADFEGELWRASAVFEADADGVVDLDRDEPKSGNYQGADAMGLFWSMNPMQGEPDPAWVLPPPRSSGVVAADDAAGEEAPRP